MRSDAGRQGANASGRVSLAPTPLDPGVKLANLSFGFPHFPLGSLHIPTSVCWDILGFHQELGKKEEQRPFA